MDLIWPTKDTVTIEVPIQLSESNSIEANATSPVPIEFYICKKRDIKKVFENFPYLKNFVAPLKAKNLKNEGSDPN